jgi:hypothetical protein
VTTLITDPLIYNYLVDVYAALGRTAESRTPYALSQIPKQDKSVKKKLDFSDMRKSKEYQK